MGQSGSTKISIAAGLLVALATSSARATYRSPGCGQSPHISGAGLHDLRLESGGLDRIFAVSVPMNYNHSHAYPIIFDYHGHHDSYREQYLNSMYFDYPAGREYIVVYPEGYHMAWEGPRYARKGVDDLAFTMDLLAHVEVEYCIDESRVYASGKSNGAGLVDILACSEEGNAFAAFAMASPALYRDHNFEDCRRKRAILESHGDADLLVSYHGNTSSHHYGGTTPDIGEWIGWWGQRDCGLDAKAEVSGDLGGYHMTTYSRNGREMVKHYRVKHLEHCWPCMNGRNTDAKRQIRHGHYNDESLDFTAVVLERFGEWSLAIA